MGIDDESSSPRFVFRSCRRRYMPNSFGVCLSESRMREICMSGSLSGNRKQSQAKPDRGDGAKAQSIVTGRLKPLRLFSTLLAISLKIASLGVAPIHEQAAREH